jgi:hypothetical protein
MVVRMARGFARLEFPSTSIMLRDSLLPSDVILSAAKDLREGHTDPSLCSGVTSSLFAALTAVLEDLLRMLLSKCLDLRQDA